MTSHWQPKTSKREHADDIEAWVQRVTRDAKVTLPSLMDMSRRDLSILSMAADASGKAKIVVDGC